MSTKIYTGFKLTCRDSESLHQWIMKIRLNIFNEIQKLSNEMPYSEASRDYYLMKQEKYVYCGDVSLFWHSEEKCWFGITFCGQEAENLIQQSPEYIEYGYWNNTDRLEGITDEQWEKREKDWEFLLENGKFIPAQAGFSAQLHPEYWPFPKK